MKILKYTFDIPQLVVENNELFEMGNNQETYTFTLLFKGVDLYEKMTGRALLTDLAKLSNSANENDIASKLDIDMVKNLAKASYCKIEGDAFHQNMITADEFSKTQAFTRIGTDTDFMVALLNMAVECCVSNKPTKTTSSKKIKLTYAKICAYLLAAKCDLNWADNQYLSTLTDVLSEYSYLFSTKEKKKVDAQMMNRFVRKE